MMPLANAQSAEHGADIAAQEGSGDTGPASYIHRPTRLVANRTHVTSQHRQPHASNEASVTPLNVCLEPASTHEERFRGNERETARSHEAFAGGGRLVGSDAAAQAGSRRKRGSYEVT